MPGPKMGPRPPDFDESVIRMSPTFIKWTQLSMGQTLRYACREFVKGRGDDEERLMRRIMIARRNNIRDHEVLKKARKINKKKNVKVQPADARQPDVMVEAVATDTYNVSECQDSANMVALSSSPTSHTCCPALSVAAPIAVTLPTATVLPAISTSAPATFPPSATTATTPHDVTAVAPPAATVVAPPTTTAVTAVVPPLNPVTAVVPPTTGIDAVVTTSTMPLAAPSKPCPSNVVAAFSDQVELEMDVPAVEATRSYRAWSELSAGSEFVYNQKYIKGKEGHDWLLRKNIWRRMRYRRENKKLVERLRLEKNKFSLENDAMNECAVDDVEKYLDQNDIENDLAGSQCDSLTGQSSSAFCSEDYHLEQQQQSQQPPVKRIKLENQSNCLIKPDENFTDDATFLAAYNTCLGSAPLNLASVKTDPSLSTDESSHLNVPSTFEMNLMGHSVSTSNSSASRRDDAPNTLVNLNTSSVEDADHDLMATAAAAACSSSGEDDPLAADPAAVAAAVEAAASFGRTPHHDAGGDAMNISSTNNETLLAAAAAVAADARNRATVDAAHAAALDAVAQLTAAATTTTSAATAIVVDLEIGIEASCGHDMMVNVVTSVSDTDLYGMHEAAAAVAAAAVAAIDAEMEEV